MGATAYGAEVGSSVHGCVLVDAVMASEEEKSLNHPVTVEKRKEGSTLGEASESDAERVGVGVEVGLSVRFAVVGVLVEVKGEAEGLFVGFEVGISMGLAVVGVLVVVKDEGDDVVGIAKGVVMGVEVGISVGFTVVGGLVGGKDKGDDVVGVVEGVCCGS